MQDVDITTFPVAPLGCNCSIIRCVHTNQTIVVDPGGEAPRIIEMLEEKGCRVRYIIHTHAHFDHCLGTAAVAEHCRSKNETEESADKIALKVGLHPDDLFLYNILGQQCRWFGLPPVESEVPIDHNIQDEEVYEFGRAKMKVLHTPGHTPGSCCFSLENTGVLFSGDTLFAQGIGRTDLPGGDSELIIKSIKNRLFTLDDGTQVVPGHGGLTRIYEERTMNPFF